VSTPLHCLLLALNLQYNTEFKSIKSKICDDLWRNIRERMIKSASTGLVNVYSETDEFLSRILEVVKRLSLSPTPGDSEIEVSMSNTIVRLPERLGN
jgi:hypothetical protein